MVESTAAARVDASSADSPPENRLLYASAERWSGRLEPQSPRITSRHFELLGFMSFIASITSSVVCPWPRQSGASGCWGFRRRQCTGISEAWNKKYLSRSAKIGKRNGIQLTRSTKQPVWYGYVTAKRV